MSYCRVLGGLCFFMSEAYPCPNRCRRWRSKPSGKCSHELLKQSTVTSTTRRAAHPSGRARCCAVAGCWAIKCQSLLARGQSLPNPWTPTPPPPDHPRTPSSHTLSPPPQNRMSCEWRPCRLRGSNVFRGCCEDGFLALPNTVRSCQYAETVSQFPWGLAPTRQLLE